MGPALVFTEGRTLMPAYQGGLALTSLAWASQRSLVCRFRSVHTRRWHHLYGGRSRIGVAAPGQRSLTAQLDPSRYPEHLMLLAIDIGDRLTDFGDSLPLRPFNRVRLRFSASGFPSDTEFLDVTAGTVPGGAVADSNRIDRLLFEGDDRYQLVTDPLPGSGTWNFQITPRDNRPPGGNVGTPATASQDVLAHPPDVPFVAGQRFHVAVADGAAIITTTVPED